ncbi:ankyrin repeat domain containing protein [Rhypophila sp. PSN 637]
MPQEAPLHANPFILAADDPNALLTLLNDNPSLATDQDSHGYSLVHAAASYNHLDLLRQLIREFSVPVDLRDEDGETALFVVETLDAAKTLVEELALDPKITNDEGQTAREKIESEGEFPDVVRYLASLEETRTVNGNGNGQHTNEAAVTGTTDLPGGIQIRMGTMEEAEAEGLEPDPEFRRRIEELAARDDFQTPEGQAELRRLVEEAVLGQGGVVGEERSVRPRQE